VETTFKVSAVFKGDKRTQEFVLHHYRNASFLPSAFGPTFLSFDSTEKTRASSYLVFLVRESDNRFAPAGNPDEYGFYKLPLDPARMSLDGR